MEYDKALEKIKKCLALSRSGNEHEAGNAMRQAQALMRQHNVEHKDVLAMHVREARVRTRSKSQPTKWEHYLVNAVCHAFVCESLYMCYEQEKAVWAFIGEGPSAQVAAYAYEVLHRQIASGRRRFIAEHCKGRSAKVKRTHADLYSEAWVAGLLKKVNAFARATLQSETINAYMAKHYPQVGEAESVKSRGSKSHEDLTPEQWRSAALGLKAAESTHIHQGVDTRAQALLEKAL